MANAEEPEEVQIFPFILILNLLNRLAFQLMTMKKFKLH